MQGKDSQCQAKPAHLIWPCPPVHSDTGGWWQFRDRGHNRSDWIFEAKWSKFILFVLPWKISSSRVIKLTFGSNLETDQPIGSNDQPRLVWQCKFRFYIIFLDKSLFWKLTLLPFFLFQILEICRCGSYFANFVNCCSQQLTFLYTIVAEFFACMHVMSLFRQTRFCKSSFRATFFGSSHSIRAARAQWVDGMYPKNIWWMICIQKKYGKHGLNPQVFWETGRCRAFSWFFKKNRARYCLVHSWQMFQFYLFQACIFGSTADLCIREEVKKVICHLRGEGVSHLPSKAKGKIWKEGLEKWFRRLMAKVLIFPFFGTPSLRARMHFVKQALFLTILTPVRVTVLKCLRNRVSKKTKVWILVFFSYCSFS